MPVTERLYVFFGLIATGKSTLAGEWAKKINAAHYNSDRVRKELAELAATANQSESWGKGIYTKEFSRRTYDALLERAERDLRNGRAVVLDASYNARPERDRVCELADRLGMTPIFVHCVCEETELKRRMEERALDPAAVSDGRWEIYLGQREKFQPPDELPAGQCLTFDTNGAVPELVAGLAALLTAK